MSQHFECIATAVIRAVTGSGKLIYQFLPSISWLLANTGVLSYCCSFKGPTIAIETYKHQLIVTNIEIQLGILF